MLDASKPKREGRSAACDNYIYLGMFLVYIIVFALCALLVKEFDNLSKPYSQTVLNVDMVKSAADSKSYRQLLLPNQMKVLLVSDPESPNSAVAVSVNAGSFNDPEAIPGLAHFLEHMLFLGSKKYPMPNHFQSYLTDFGGNSNAFTSPEHTVFFYDVYPPALDESLDIFAQFFIDPLFDGNFTAREVHAVDAENSKNYLVDEWKLYQLLRSTCNPQHPFHKFSTGNLQTLVNDLPPNTVLRDELVNFFAAHYSAGAMSAVLVGPQDLNTLEVIATKNLIQVPNKQVQVSTWADVPVRLRSQVGMMYQMLPIEDVDELDLHWVMPAPSDNYREKPLQYLISLLGRKGPGSAFASLSGSKLILDMSVDILEDTAQVSLIQVKFKLTADGLARVEDVIETFFEYVSVLRAQGVKESTWNELKNADAIEFQTKPRRNSGSYASSSGYARSLVNNLFIYPPEHVVVGEYLWADYNQAMIEMYVDLVSPYRMFAVVSSSSFKNQGLPETEKWYGTPYRATPISDANLGKWSHVLLDGTITPPSGNPFIVSMNVTDGLKPRVLETVRTTVFPKLLQSKDGLTVWLKDESSAGEAFVIFYVNIVTPALSGAAGRAATELYIMLVTDNLQSKVDDATVAGASFSIKVKAQGIQIKVSCFSSQLQLLLKTLTRGLASSTDMHQRFPLLLNDYRRGLANWDLATPVHKQACQFGKWMQDASDVLDAELLAAMPASYSFTDLENHANALLSTAQIEVLAMGNIGATTTLALSNDIVTTLGSAPLAANLVPQIIVRELQPNYVTRVRKEVADPEQVNSATAVMFQFGPSTDSNFAVLDVLIPLLDDKAFTMLRTYHQLGYIVCFKRFQLQNVLGAYLVVQSPTHNGDELLAEITSFLTSVRDDISHLSDADIAGLVGGAVAEYTSPFPNLESEAKEYWQEILTKQYDFGRALDRAAAVKNVKASDLLKFFDRYFVQNVNSRTLVVEVFGKGGMPPVQAAPQEILVTDPQQVFLTSQVYAGWGVNSKALSQ